MQTKHCTLTPRDLVGRHGPQLCKYNHCSDLRVLVSGPSGAASQPEAVRTYVPCLLVNPVLAVTAVHTQQLYGTLTCSRQCRFVVISVVVTGQHFRRCRRCCFGSGCNCRPRQSGRCCCFCSRQFYVINIIAG